MADGSIHFEGYATCRYMASEFSSKQRKPLRKIGRYPVRNLPSEASLDGSIQLRISKE